MKIIKKLIGFLRSNKAAQQILALLILSFITSIHKTNACSMCNCNIDTVTASRNVISGPVISPQAYTLPQGKFAMGSSIQYLNVSEFSAAILNDLNNRRVHGHSSDATMSVSVGAVYGITDNLNVIISYPYNFAFNLITTNEDGSTINGGNSIGFGDLTLVTKYRFLNCKERDIHVALFAGIKMPTGQTGVRNDLGDRFGEGAQPGTGSWDPITGLVLTKRMGNFSLDTGGIYRLSTKGGQDTTLGDTVNYNFSVSYGVNRKKKDKDFIDKIFPDRFLGSNLSWTLALEMNGIWQEALEVGGIKEEIHGANLIFLSPGINLLINNDLATRFSVGFPVIQESSEDIANTGIRLVFGIVKVF